MRIYSNRLSFSYGLAAIAARKGESVIESTVTFQSSTVTCNQISDYGNAAGGRASRNHKSPRGEFRSSERARGNENSWKLSSGDRESMLEDNAATRERSADRAFGLRSHSVIVRRREPRILLGFYVGQSPALTLPDSRSTIL